MRMIFICCMCKVDMPDIAENDMAMLTYFNNDGESYVSVGDEKRDDGNVAFSAGQYEVWNYQIIKKDEALAGLMDFFQ